MRLRWNRIQILMSGLVTDLIFYLVSLKQTQPRSNRAMGSETKLIVKPFKKFLLALIFGFLTTVFFRHPKIGT